MASHKTPCESDDCSSVVLSMQSYINFKITGFQQYGTEWMKSVKPCETWNDRNSGRRWRVRGVLWPICPTDWGNETTDRHLEAAELTENRLGPYFRYRRLQEHRFS